MLNRKKLEKLAKGLCIFLFAMFMIIIVGLLFIIPTKIEKESCNIGVTASVVEIIEEKNDIGYIQKLYKSPVVKYTYEKNEYIATAKALNSKTGYLVNPGDEIDILVDSTAPTHIYILNTDKGLQTVYLILLLPICLSILSLIWLIKIIVILKRSF